ncbi:Fic family protein [Spirosoma flavus]
MHNLEVCLNSNESDDISVLIKLAIQHYQFECIHPFYDGNGRTRRIINVLYLLLHDLLGEPILYLSGYIIAHKRTIIGFYRPCAPSKTGKIGSYSSNKPLSPRLVR